MTFQQGGIFMWHGTLVSHLMDYLNLIAFNDTQWLLSVSSTSIPMEPTVFSNSLLDLMRLTKKGLKHWGWNASNKSGWVFNLTYPSFFRDIHNIMYRYLIEKLLTLNCIDGIDLCCLFCRFFVLVLVYVIGGILFLRFYRQWVGNVSELRVLEKPAIPCKGKSILTFSFCII